MFVRHRHALTGESSEYAQIVEIGTVDIVIVAFPRLSPKYRNCPGADFIIILTDHY